MHVELAEHLCFAIKNGGDLLVKKGGSLMPSSVGFNCLVSRFWHTENFCSSTA